MHKLSLKAISLLSTFTTAISLAENNNIVYDDSLISYAPMIEVVPQGAVGIFKRGGFLEGIYDPGIYFHLPVVTTLLSVNTRPQVDVLTNIECGTKDGLRITFPKVTIYNMLSRDNAWSIISRFGESYDEYLVVHPAIQAINELCAEMTVQDLYIDQYTTINERLTTQLRTFQEEQNSSLKITQVTVSKPTLPKNIQNNYQQIVSEQTRIIAVQEEHKRQIREEETQQARKRIEEENKKIISLMEYEKKISEAKKQAELSKIEVDKESYRNRTQADSEAYSRNMTTQAESEAVRLKGMAEAGALLAAGQAEAEVKQRLAEINERLLSENYVRIKIADAFRDSQHVKIIILGNKIPESIVPFIDLNTVKSMLQDSGDNDAGIGSRG